MLDKLQGVMYESRDFIYPSDSGMLYLGTVAVPSNPHKTMKSRHVYAVADIDGCTASQTVWTTDINFHRLYILDKPVKLDLGNFGQGLVHFDQPHHVKATTKIIAQLQSGKFTVRTREVILHSVADLPFLTIKSFMY